MVGPGRISSIQSACARNLTITWQDIYDYSRCPKIVAFRTMGLKTRHVERRTEPSIQPSTSGKLGERLTAKLLPSLTRGDMKGISGREKESLDKLGLKGVLRSLPTVERLVQKATRDALNQPLGVSSRDIQELVRRDIVGLIKIASKVREEFGELKVLGRGMIRTPRLPASVRPDLVFAPQRRSKYLIAEVKNTARPNPADDFQASFYNSSSYLGGLILLERTERGNIVLSPEVMESQEIDTVLLYPRIGETQRITRLTGIARVIRGVWESKQLGMMGRQPEAPKGEYCSRCQWDGFCSNWPKRGPREGTLDEVAIPLPLIYAKGCLEEGLNLDSYALSRYVQPYANRVEYQILSDLKERFERIRKLKMDLQRHGGMEEQVKQLEATENLLFSRVDEGKTRVIQELFGLSRGEVLELLGSRQAILGPRAVSRAMASELEPWKHILHNRGYAMALKRASRLMELTAIFPALTGKIVGRAWRSWT